MTPLLYVAGFIVAAATGHWFIAALCALALYGAADRKTINH